MCLYENSNQDFRLFSFLPIMTFGCAHVFPPLGRVESTLNKLLILGNCFKPLEDHNYLLLLFIYLSLDCKKIATVDS